MAYRMMDGKAWVELRAGGVSVLGYEALQSAADLCVKDALFQLSRTPHVVNEYDPTLDEDLLDLEDYRGAMAYLREHLAVTPDGELVAL